MKRNIILGFTAAAVGMVAGFAAPSAAQADWKPGRHYVAFLAGDNATAKGVRLTNSLGGGSVCYNLKSLTKSGGAYTTTFVVYNGHSVAVDFFTSNTCWEFAATTSITSYPHKDPHKYWYITTQ